MKHKQIELDKYFKKERDRTINKQAIQICFPNKSIFQTVCKSLKEIDNPLGGLITVPFWYLIISSLLHAFNLPCLMLE